MHRTLLPKISLLFVICTLLAAYVFGQAKPVGEIDLAKCWAYPAVGGAVIATDGVFLFAGLGGGKVEGLSLDGKKLWASELGGEISSNILASGRGVFLATSTDSAKAGKPGESVLRSLSKETGITNWTLKLPYADRHFLGIFNGSVIVVSKSGVIQSVDAKSGSVKWTREIAEGFSAGPVFTASNVYVAATGKQIFGVSLLTGEIESMRKMPYAITALTATAGGEIVAGDERGNVSSLSAAADKTNWKFRSGGEISRVITVGDHLLVTSHDNFVYFLTGRNGGVAWKRRMSGRAAYVSNFTNKFAIISGVEENKAVFTDLSTRKMVGQIVFDPEENVASEAVSANGLIYILTGDAVYSYSLNGCTPNKKADPQIMSVRQFKIISAAKAFG